MIEYGKSMKIIELHYEECLRFWKGDIDLTLRDIALMKRNPFSPMGELLDRRAIIDFVNERMK